jgi:hypothetical protein
MGEDVGRHGEQDGQHVAPRTSASSIPPHLPQPHPIHTTKHSQIGLSYTFMHTIVKKNVLRFQHNHHAPQRAPRRMKHVRYYPRPPRSGYTTAIMDWR